ncbi:MAG: substrate-binding domain-containing protein, partial [Chitinophagales bacterium]|nr:substrate-binding domain-containing protein [Chitinophagales bacterium]
STIMFLENRILMSYIFSLPEKSASIYFFLFLFVFASCSNYGETKNHTVDTPIKGQIIIGADESFAPIVNLEISTFSNIYPDTKINVNYKPEAEVLVDFINNKFPVVISTRKLNEEEVKYFKQIREAPYQIRMGTDAVAFIVNTSNPDSNLSHSQLLNILSGKISDWKSISSASSLDNIVLVFDNTKSSTIRYIKEDVLKGNEFTKAAYAVDSSSAIIKYVEDNPNSIGVISVNRISNSTDSLSQSFLKRIKVMGISNPDSANQKVFYRPYRKYMLYRQYPFLRDLYLLNREGHIGLGTGFATYMISEEGQLIIHHAGLVAAKQPVRVIELRNEF